MPNNTLTPKLKEEILDCSSAKGHMRRLLENEGFTIRQTGRKDHVSIFWADWGERLGGFAPQKPNERGFREEFAKQLVENITRKLEKLALDNDLID